MSDKNYIAKMTGYKATNADMTCNGHQFTLGEWAEIDGGEIELCKRGFHFCVHPSGPACYYGGEDSRVFKIEAEQVLDCPTEAGADFKLVSRRIRLLEEITPGMGQGKGTNTGNWNTGNRNTGDQNTGNWNTGNWNTGNWNTGYQNTGDRNTGNWNTGYQNTGNRNTGNWNTGYQNTGNWNTGNWNTGYQNTGNRNTGYQNTGDRNTGNWNTGYQNTGDWNTGDQNTGNWNTGNWNTGNWNTGYFCAEAPLVVSFDTQTKLTREEFFEQFPEAYTLGEALMQNESAVILFAPFARIPGITETKLAALHAKHIAGRKAASAK